MQHTLLREISTKRIYTLRLLPEIDNAKCLCTCIRTEKEVRPTLIFSLPVML